ncbi:hypothetical protein PoB_003199900 [Plakobranchus ocellatus]|uniref:Uncharacterized protein n=1 Tax=Plakobranchus ocellatus TaxID=259542 RepID=A0AAV4ACX4_9GAST|nr:hypothetical protein PoB_003199900 [Plakobranchus ocellatus]
MLHSPGATFTRHYFKLLSLFSSGATLTRRYFKRNHCPQHLIHSPDASLIRRYIRQKVILIRCYAHPKLLQTILSMLTKRYRTRSYFHKKPSSFNATPNRIYHYHKTLHSSDVTITQSYTRFTLL